MKNFYKRLYSFSARLAWLTKLKKGNFIAAALFLLIARKNCNALSKATYKKTNFIYRAKDLTALKEVLIDEEYKFLTPYLTKTKAPLIIDAGAHIGLFALYCFEKNKDSRITSIEADPETYDALEKNKEQNPRYNWKTLNNAASSQNKTLYFEQFENNSMSNRVKETGNIKVEGISSKKLLSNMQADQKIDILKIDIEGSEEEFLCNDHAILDRSKIVIIELHPSLCNTDNVQDLLTQKFKTVEQINNRESSKPLLFCYN